MLAKGSKGLPPGTSKATRSASCTTADSRYKEEKSARAAGRVVKIWQVEGVQPKALFLSHPLTDNRTETDTNYL